MSTNSKDFTGFPLSGRALPGFLECNVNLKIETPKGEPVQLKITDLNEHLIEEHRITVKQFRFQIPGIRKNWNSGVYLICVQKGACIEIILTVKS